jgi:adenosine deaminase
MNNFRRSLNIRGLLHDHLDGSAAMMDVLPELYQLASRPYPFASADDCRRFFADPYANLVAKFGCVTGVLQSREALQLAARAYVERRASEGYQYVEAKFAPQYHCGGGLTMEEVTETLTEELWSHGFAHRLMVMPIVCIGREVSPDVGVTIAKIAMEYGGFVGLDLVCDEANHPPEKHKPAFDLTRGCLKRDCHAGEWVLPEPAATYGQRLLENVRTAVRVLNADGVGHALPLVNDPELCAEIVDRGIRVTSCPASYVQSKLIGHVGELGLNTLLSRGVKLTINPDDDLFLPDMAATVKLVTEAYDLTNAQRQQLEDNVVTSAFHPNARLLLD